MPRFRLILYTTICLFAFCCLRVSAQTGGVLPFGLKAGLEAGGYISSPDATPFWLRTNQFGIVPNTGPAGQMQGSLRKDYVFFDSLSNRPQKMDWGFAVNPVVTYSDQDQFNVVLPEAHVKARFKMLEIYAGRRREVMGLGIQHCLPGFMQVREMHCQFQRCRSGPSHSSR